MDVAWQTIGRMQVEAGALVEHTQESRQRQRPVTGTVYAVVNDYSGSATRSGAYVLTQWPVTSSLTLAPGVRVDYFTLTDDSTTSPWMQAEWHVRSRLTVEVAPGATSSFQLRTGAGRLGALTPRLEQAEQYDLGVEGLFGSTMRAQITV